MKIIQIILVPALLMLTFFYFRHFRSLLLDRIIILILGLCAVILVIFPDISGKLAHALGVGRVVDLVMYLALIGLSFICLLLFSKIREIHQQMTDLARAQAIAHARQPEEKGLKVK